MKEKLQFNFLVDKENNTITIKKEFAANRQMIWDYYTKSDLLDQWFAPKPFTTKTQTMDFREGGHWLYAMVDPNGPEHWGRMDYLNVQPVGYYAALDGFCDSEGNLNPDLPRAEWKVTFSDQDENTMMETVVTYKSHADMETVIEMGMKEGLISTLERLDDLLSQLSK